MLQSGSVLKSGSIWPQTGVKENKPTFTSSIYPNPVSDKSTIQFTLDKASNIEVSVYNATGSKVAEIAEAQYPAGENRIIINASSLPKGLYFVRIDNGTSQSAAKMIVK